MITILIIDDNTIQANSIANSLEKEIYTIQIAKTSQDALVLLDNSNLGLVIINAQMRDNIGLVILSEIRKKFSQNQLPVLAVFETVNTPIEEQFLANGINCTINLPISEISLKLRVGNLLQVRQTAIHLQLKIEQQKILFQNSPVPSLLIDQSGIVIDVNKSAFDLFGVKVGLNFDVYCGEMFNCYIALQNTNKCGTLQECSDCIIRGSINKTFSTKQNSSIREGKFRVLINNQEQERIIIVTSTYIRDISTNLALLTFEDVTDLRKSQQIIARTNADLTNLNEELQAQAEELTEIADQLAESNQFISQIIQSAQEGIVVYDKNLRFKVWNPFMEKITGLPASQVIGKFPLELFPFLRDIGMIDNYKKALAGEIITANDFQYFIPNTQLKGWASETSAPLRNTKAEVIGIISTVNDITLRKENEEILKEHSEEILSQNEEYQQLNEELQRANHQLTLAKERAEESETKYKELFEANTDSITIFRISPNGLPSKILETNDNALKLVGYTKQEMQTMTANDFEVNYTPENIQKRIEDIQAQGFTHFETLIRHKDGHEINAEVKVIAINYKNQPALMNILRDITERKQAEKALLESEDRFKKLSSFTFEGIIIHNNGIAIDVNQSTVKILGYERDEMIGMNLFDIIHHSSHAIVKENIVKQVAKTYQIIGVRKNGSTFDAEIEAENIFYNGQYFRVACIRDITERKQAEMQTNYLSSIIENTENICVVKNLDLKVVATNMSFVKAAGKTSINELLGKNDAEIFGVSPQDEPIKSYMNDERAAQKLKKGGKIEREELVIYPDKSERVFMTAKFPIYDNTDTLIGTANISTDITQRKEIEKQISNQNLDLQKLNADKDRFMQILAHDLKSPFNSILGFLSLMTKNIRKYDTDKIEKLINIVHNSAKNTLKLLDDILFWVKANSGKIPFQPKKLNFETICNELIENLKLTADTKNIKINYFEADKINLFADKNMLNTILRNLISNSIKFTNKNGQIDIYAEANEHNITITVSDNGIGMEPQTVAKLFDITQKITTEGTENETGTGLGLLLCKEFVEKHGGTIWVESQAGRGSDFKFTLPIRKN